MALVLLCSNLEIPEYFSFWFGASTFMLQDYKLQTRSIAVRFVALLWWFFTIVLISVYIGQLASALSAQTWEAQG